MFDSLDERSPVGRFFLAQGTRYFVQFLFQYPLVALAVLPVNAVVSYLGMRPQVAANVSFEGFALVEFLYLGVLLGWAAGKLVPSLITTGVWIAAFPLLVILCTSISFGVSCNMLSEDLFSTGGNEGAAVAIISAPSCAAIGYSVGMILVSREQKLRRDISGVMRLAHLLPWLTFFSLSMLLMLYFEQPLVDWGRQCGFGSIPQSYPLR